MFDCILIDAYGSLGSGLIGRAFDAFAIMQIECRNTSLWLLAYYAWSVAALALTSEWTARAFSYQWIVCLLLNQVVSLILRSSDIKCSVNTWLARNSETFYIFIFPFFSFESLVASTCQIDELLNILKVRSSWNFDPDLWSDWRWRLPIISWEYIVGCYDWI